MKQTKTIIASEERILDSETSGELILLMSFLTARGNKLASYLGKSEPAVTTTLSKLQSIGLVIMNKRGVRELNKDKLNEVSKKLAITLCKKQYESEIQTVKKFRTTKIKKISDLHLTLLGDPTEKEKKSKFVVALRKKDEKRLSDMRNEFVSYLKKREEKELKNIEQLFSENKFNDFLVVYLHLFFPSIKKKLSEIVQYYLKYGDIKLKNLYRSKRK